MIKLIIFDLDGVLVSTKKLHFDSLNEALTEIDSKYCISLEEHLTKYDGLKTNEKLKILTEEKGLPKNFYEKIWTKKQEITIKMLDKIDFNPELKSILKNLKKQGFKIACCSNSIKKTVTTILEKLQIINLFDLVVSNEDVKNSKPHPEMYWYVMSQLNLLPEETLIVEDSPYGLLAANRAGSNIFRVSKTTDVTLDNIINKINESKKNQMKIPKWKNDKLNVLIPMAGAGSRFESAGFTFPKPLIDVKGKPMIQVVVDNLNIDANYIYVVQKKHREKYNLDTLLNIITPNCVIVEVDGLTEGAACTALIAKEFINNDYPLFFANSDQYVEWDSNEFMYKMNESECDGGIVTFKSIHPKWSFAKTDKNGLVVEVAEKNPISDDATVGYYYWKKGSDFVKYAEKMIKENKRINNEFYVCPVFNEAISDGKKIKIFESTRMWGLGTPEDLSTYLENF
jgi:HAD superfamily hydrolase (TIGR01509 family)